MPRQVDVNSTPQTPPSITRSLRVCPGAPPRLERQERISYHQEYQGHHEHQEYLDRRYCLHEEHRAAQDAMRSLVQDLEATLNQQGWGSDPI